MVLPTGALSKWELRPQGCRLLPKAPSPLHTPRGELRGNVTLYLEEKGSDFRTGLFYYIKAADFEISLMGGKGVLWKEHSFPVTETS